MEVMKFQSENNAGFARLEPSKQAEQAAAIYDRVREEAMRRGAPAARTPVAPATPTMPPQRRPPIFTGVQPPADGVAALTPRSILGR
jgi:hypothetical protein